MTTEEERVMREEEARLKEIERILAAKSLSKRNLAKIIGESVAIEEYQATYAERLMYAENETQDREEKLKRQGGGIALRHLSRVLGIGKEVDTVARHYKSDIDARDAKRRARNAPPPTQG
ncbi:MAG TPA: hypothetical protein VN711_01565 [Candidatus Saccharimonadales bacterium]|nr:hypothetical protein [Candidatus Saccharimonadales bacterium]